jgi:hypothetical protein
MSGISSENDDDPRFAPLSPTKRCLTCYYVLDNLPEPRCPECGREFHPDVPSTYTTKPPFLWWRFWLPGMALACLIGGTTYALLIPRTGFGWAVTLAIPMMLGALVGYSTRVGIWGAQLVGIATLLACLLGITFAGAAGVFCALILVGMAVVPLGVSVVLGIALRGILKDSSWGQRHWLPVLLIAVIPASLGTLEWKCLSPAAMVSVQTTRTLDAPLHAAWGGVLFYEDVKHDPPWLLRFALRRPLYATGRPDRVGARKTCVYTRGHLTKQVTAIDPLRELRFAVVEQQMFEDYSVRLIDGDFHFERIDATHTAVTLTTRYQPLLRPRFAWQPAESYVVHLLHNHVLDGMAEKAEAEARKPAVRVSAASRVW